MLSDIITKFAYQSTNDKTIHLFYDFNRELNNICLQQKDQMAVMIRLNWWKERIEEIRLDKKGNFTPLLLEVKATFNKKAMRSLEQIVDLRLIAADAVRNHTYQETIDQYLAPLTKAKASLLKVPDSAMKIYSALEYIEQNPNKYETIVLNKLFAFAKNEYHKSNYNRNSNLEKTYYKSSQILLSKYNSLSGQFRITPNYFRMLLGLKLL